MDLLKLKTQIQNNSLYNFYLFVGEELGIMKIYLNQISNCLNKPLEWQDSIRNCLHTIQRSSLLASPKVYVVQDDSTFLKSEKLQKNISRNLKDNTLILIYTKADKRSKFWKNADYVKFNPLNPEMLANYIMKSVKLSTSNAVHLANICNCSYDRCLLEADKINQYTNYRNKIGENISADQAFRELLSEGVIYQPIPDITFKLVDAIMNRSNISEIQKYLILAKEKNEPKLLLVSLLYTNFRNLYMYQSLSDRDKDPQKRTGLTSFELRSAKYRLGNYSDSELLRAMKILQSLEYGVKSGEIFEAIILDYFVAMVV